MPVTIGRNRRQYVLNIKESYTECHKYDPESGGLVPADPAEAWALLLDRPGNGEPGQWANPEARLVEHDGRVSYTIHLGNDFYELRRPA